MLPVAWILVLPAFNYGVSEPNFSRFVCSVQRLHKKEKKKNRLRVNLCYIHFSCGSSVSNFTIPKWELFLTGNLMEKFLANARP